MSNNAASKECEAIKVSGTVESGVGIASKHISTSSDELEVILGERVLPGTLNVRLDRPLALDRRAALNFDGGRMLWPARINGKPVWLYRWLHAPLHIAELVSSHHIRNEFRLHDGDRVIIEIDRQLVARTPLLAWALLWKWREGWYRKKRYNDLVTRIAARTWFGLVASPVMIARQTLAALGIVPRLPYAFSRIKARNEQQKLLNLLNYTKASGASYSAAHFPAGYHSIDFDGRTLRGQRDPFARLNLVPVDFAGKSVLDLGSNQGGMLLALSNKLRWGVGVDFDARMVNAANRIRRAKNAGQLDYYVFDLEHENLDLIRDLLPESRVDVCFLLSVCMWLENWREVIDFAASVSDMILFESNGSDEQQDEQIAYLASVCSEVEMLAEESADDPGQKLRRFALGKTREDVV